MHIDNLVKELIVCGTIASFALGSGCAAVTQNRKSVDNPEMVYIVSGVRKNQFLNAIEQGKVSFPVAAVSHFLLNTEEYSCYPGFVGDPLEYRIEVRVYNKNKINIALEGSEILRHDREKQKTESLSDLTNEEAEHVYQKIISKFLGK